MKEFLLRHGAKVMGILSGFDRLVFRGTLRALSCPEIMASYCSVNRVLLKDFGDHVLSVSRRVKEAATAAVTKLGRPVKYLSSPGISKEDEARKIARRDQIDSGVIALLSCVETCRSYSVNRNRETKRLELQYGVRRCLHLYRYQIHPVFGFMHVRLQTWFPFMIHVCLNGREWLSRQLDQAGIPYQRRENCFTQVGDIACAQQLLREQLRASWPSLLNELVREIHPEHRKIFQRFSQRYYWTTHQSEWATDVLFSRPQDLAALYPGLTRYAVRCNGKNDGHEH